MAVHGRNPDVITWSQNAKPNSNHPADMYRPNFVDIHQIHRFFSFFHGAKFFAMRIILVHAMDSVDGALESPRSQLSNAPKIKCISLLIDDISSFENVSIPDFSTFFNKKVSERCRAFREKS